MAKPTVLVILDGWGLGDNNNPTGNAILLAKNLITTISLIIIPTLF